MSVTAYRALPAVAFTSALKKGYRGYQKGQENHRENCLCLHVGYGVTKKPYSVIEEINAGSYYRRLQP